MVNLISVTECKLTYHVFPHTVLEIFLNEILVLCLNIHSYNQYKEHEYDIFMVSDPGYPWREH